MNKVLTNYYKAIKDLSKKTRYDIVLSAKNYKYFEHLLLNKREPNLGGLSFHFSKRSEHFGGSFERRTDMAISRNINITSVIMPDPTVMIAFGDIYKTEDAIIILFSSDWSEIELFIAQGQKFNSQSLYTLAVDGELDDEMNELRKSATQTCGNKMCYFKCNKPDNQQNE